jgi:hypothetical protein
VNIGPLRRTGRPAFVPVQPGASHKWTGKTQNWSKNESILDMMKWQKLFGKVLLVLERTRKIMNFQYAGSASRCIALQNAFSNLMWAIRLTSIRTRSRLSRQQQVSFSVDRCFVNKIQVIMRTQMNYHKVVFSHWSTDRLCLFADFHRHLTRSIIPCIITPQVIWSVLEHIERFVSL